MVQVLLVEDDAAIRTTLTRALRDQGHSVAAVGAGLPALSAAVESKPDVVLLDLNMPEVGGLEACASLRAQGGGPEVLVLTVSDEEPDLYAALRVGAAGYLLKDMPPSELVAAVLEAGSGEPRIPASMAGRVLSEVDSGGMGAIDDLSPREHEVLELMAEGLRNREIAERLFLSEATVKTHVRHLLEKLRLRNRAEAAAFATRVARRHRERS